LGSFPGNGNYPLNHLQIFFDSGGDSGYFPDGVRPDYGHSINEYQCGADVYDDQIMREAVNIVAGQFPYSSHIYFIPWPDCQTFITSVVLEYYNLTGNKSDKKNCQSH
jgi:hypothetical protein